MNQININGRVNILQPDTKTQFALYDKIVVQQPSDYREALQGNFTDSPLSLAYFSKQNITIIQNGIRHGVFKQSKGQYLVAPQSEDILKVVMRSVYLQYSANMPDNISSQIKSLNNIVLDYCVKQVYGEAKGYQQYLHDASTLVVPMERPVFSLKNKTLEQKPWF